MIAELITSVLVTGCGWADFVYDDIDAKIQEKPTGQLVRPGGQGENHRRIYLYEDGSWFLTYEFFHFGDATKDISCVMAIGSGEDFDRIFNFRVDELPERDLGEPVERPEIVP